MELLGKSLSVNAGGRQATVHQVALCATDADDMVLMIPPGEPKNAHIVPLAHTGAQHGTRVPAVRLDSRPEWRAIERVKIDVEGAEELVWAGMQGLLDNGVLRTVILEFAAARYADAPAFLQALQAPGFSLARIDVRHGIVATSVAEILAGNPHEDIMLVLRR